MDQDKKGKVSYKDTLNLPRTDFPIRANAKENDPKMIKRWKEEKIDRKTFEANIGKEKYILHDGPPYANGHIHLGHAYNKLLKDLTRFAATTPFELPGLIDSAKQLLAFGTAAEDVEALVDLHVRSHV